ncbi:MULTISPECIES: hypothetical protein [unclassified Peribacillus]|uniref:hypothetical protein n=1 Tax=unclassified Peribacillus TaxID=2675266 RepID=UPI001E4E9902|nr:hypothetical protein [Peribacillus sp. Bi96]
MGVSCVKEINATVPNHYRNRHRYSGSARLETSEGTKSTQSKSWRGYPIVQNIDSAFLMPIHAVQILNPKLFLLGGGAIIEQPAFY